MRVIAGEAGGVPLAAPRGSQTRPTAGKVKEAIFSVLGDVGCSGRVLDMYAGSGALGIEALSRGADSSDFVEVDRRACDVITANLRKTKLAERGHVMCMTAARFLAFPPRAAYDLILMDPPYALVESLDVMERLMTSALAGPSTVLVLEHSGRVMPPARAGGRPSTLTRTYGDSAFTIYTFAGFS